MKNLFLKLTVTWLVSTAGGRSFAQCLNPDFTDPAFAPCATASQGTCGTFDNCNGWSRMQGSPQIDPYTITINKDNVTINAYYIYMWASANPDGTHTGEGVFTTYNTFLANHSYDVKLVYSTFGGGGSVVASAANNLVQPARSCGSLSQPIADAVTIQIQNDGATTSATPGTLSGSFAPSKDYNELWIYPLGVGPAGADQNNLELFNVYVCPSCTYQMIYDNGAIPSGESVAGSIEAGSTAGSGGSGIVTIASGVSTTLTAATRIDLLRNFQANPGTGTFVARIVPCTSSIPTTTIFDGDSVTVSVPPPRPDITGTVRGILSAGQAPQIENSDSTSFAGLHVFPTISAGTFTIAGSATDLTNAVILVTDEIGRTVYKLYNSNGNTTLNLDLGKLGSGLYFLQVNNGVKSTTQKIIIQK